MIKRAAATRRRAALLAIALASLPGAAAGDEGGRYQLLRYEEDLHPERVDAADDLFAPIKHIAFGERRDYYLSLGGDLRWRYERFVHPEFGDDPPVDDYVLYRAFTHADLHLSRYSRTFVQLSSLGVLGKEGGLSQLDLNALTLQQAFTELRFAAAGGRLILRAGRQELVLGSGRLVAVRKGPNFRRSFDMLRLAWAGARLRIDAVGGAAIRPAPGVFDDRTNLGDVLWGVYSTVDLRPDRVGLDAYYLGVRREGRAYQDVAGIERRHSLGLRLFGAAKPLDYNLEGIVQFGAVGDASILAWTLASDTGITFVGGELRGRAGLRADVTSGDRTAGDGRLGTFDALYPNLKYFSEAGLLVPSNHLDLHPTLSFGGPRIRATADWSFFWRYSLADAIYAPPGVVGFAAERSDERFVGHQITAELGAALTRHVRLTLYYAHFFRGAAVDEAGGRDVDFLGTWIEHTF